jgi:hypothetical protein
MNRGEQKILNSFSKALELIDQVRKATGAELDHERDLLIWRSAAETEYLAFLIANMHGLEDFIPGTERGLAVSADTARDLIEKARGLLQSDPRLAYASVRQAVRMLRAMSTDERRPRRGQPS